MQQQRSSSNPSQYSWNAALKDIQSAQKMDEVFGKVRAAIEQHGGLLKRDAAVRLKLWLTKLSEQTSNPVWKKNRNAYAKLLLNQLKQGRLEKPFNAAPPEGPLQTLPASLTYTYSLPRTASTRSTIRSGASVTSSQGSPGSNAAEAPQLDDYMGRHASSSRTASAGTALSPKHQYSGAQEPASAELSHQRLGLWVGESNPSRQSSIDRAKSPPRRQRSESSGLGSSPQRQKSGILRTGSSGSSLRGQEDHSAHAHKSPTRGPSRLRDSSTDAEVHYAAVGRKQSPVRESSTEEEACPHSRVHMPRSVARESSAEEEEERVGHRHSPRDRHGLRQAAVKVTQVQPQHQHYHTAEKYLSRAGVREALSPRRQPSHTHGYAAKARTLDLQDNCTLADEEQDQVHSRGSPRQHHARDSGQGGAQVQLGGTKMGLARGLQGARRGDSIDLADESWQPSKLELQARLGASKERQLELEWRLQQAEQKIAQAQAQQVAHQLAASQPAQQPHTHGHKKDRLKRDLSKLIHKYEKRQYRWGSPRKAASIEHLLPLDYRLGSSGEESFDGLADISAALQSCSERTPTDMGRGEHPLSQGPQLQGQAGGLQHNSSGGTLSGGYSSHSVVSETDAQLHRQASRQAGSDVGLHAQSHVSDGEDSRFMKKLQDFQKCTDMLRQQISLS